MVSLSPGEGIGAEHETNVWQFSVDSTIDPSVESSLDPSVDLLEDPSVDQSVNLISR